MLDGFFEFEEDDSSAGFRLSEIQVYNWGTFHNKVVTLTLEGRNCLLTGDIGSGKSTLVDAVTTLLVPSQKVAYNKAAGADFKERSLRSYVMGYYKSERSDGGYATRPVPLREAGTSHSVILGVFYNQSLSQTVTLAQVFFQKEPSGQPERFFIVADRPLSISGDLSDFGKELSLLRKRLKREPSIELFSSFPEYGAAFRRRFGLKNEQALELFHQTVSLKTVGNLTGFVQDHMLEPFDSQSPIDNLIGHFEDLDRAHNAILRAKEQIETLSPLVENLDRYQLVDQEVSDKVGIREELKYYFAERKRLFLAERLSKETDTLERQRQRIETTSQRIRALRGDREELAQAISENGGARLESLKSEKLRLEKEKGSRVRRATAYDELTKRLELPRLEDIDRFSDTRRAAEERIESTSSERNDIEHSLSELEYEFRNQRQEHSALEEEITSLKGRKSNIDRRQIEIRRQLCSELSLEEDSLPFIGELLAVRPEEAPWEGAIERVLRSFALTLLIPDSLYRTVSKWVDSTHLRGRLVYYRVMEKDPRQPGRLLAGSVVDKLTVKRESEYHSWLSRELSNRYGDLICCEGLEEFRRVSRGLTRSGQIKGGVIHHEKDDRFDISDRRRYVLGWVNTAKIAELERLKGQKEHSLQQIATKIAGEQKRRAAIEAQLDDLKKLLTYEVFEELDWKSPAARIEEIKSEIELLESRSDVLKNLQKRLSQIDTQLEEQELEQSKLQRASGAIEQTITDLEQQLTAVQDLLGESIAAIETTRAKIDPILGNYIGERRFYLESCDSTERAFREKLQAEIDAAKRRLERLRDQIISAMGDFNREYPTETREIDISIDSGKEYRRILDQLIGENLPAFEHQFKTLLNENTIREIAGFQALLNKECQQIKERVDQINRSLHGIDYNKDRYIVLEAMKTNDVEIRSFQNDLKSCVEGSLGGEVDQQYSEGKFLQVKSLINRFKGREGYSDLDRRWRAKVTDVRNWFAFAASERWREDDQEYEHYTDSGGKSGGQKEKLAYTVLAASLAYQFGLEWGEVRSRSFRFVVIDEAFGRGSDESARYGLDLFKRLNLQLLIVTPLQKIHIIEPYVSSVGFVHNPAGKDSLLRTLTIEEYLEEKQRHAR